MAEDRELNALQTALNALKPLDAEDQQRALNWLASKLGLTTPTSGDQGAGSWAGQEVSTDGGTGPGKLGTIKQFLKDKSPDNDVGRTTALAYYLTHAGGKDTVTAADLSKARTDAALPSFNVSRGAGNARSAGYLTTTGKRGNLKITSIGESLVDAMPDKEAMKKVMARRRKTKRKGAGRKRATAKRRSAKKS